MKPADFDSNKTPYAYIWGERDGEWAHVYVRVFNLTTELFNNPRLEITSQCGGLRERGQSPEMYGFHYGFSGAYSNMMTLSEMEASIKVMRRISRRLDRMNEGRYEPHSGNFAMFALHVLAATGVKCHFINENFGEGFAGNIDTLPCSQDNIEVYESLVALQKQALDYVNR